MTNTNQQTVRIVGETPEIIEAGQTSIATNLAAKKKAHAALLQARGLKPKVRTAILALVTSGVDSATVTQLREALAVLPVVCLEVAEANHDALLSADIALFATSDLAQSRSIRHALTAGSIPVVYEHIAPKNLAEDYDPTTEQGNSFFATTENVWGIFAATVRAVETFRFPYDWQGIVRNAMNIK